MPRCVTIDASGNANTKRVVATVSDASQEVLSCA
jgi:hypothetical protein